MKIDFTILCIPEIFLKDENVNNMFPINDIKHKENIPYERYCNGLSSIVYIKNRFVTREESKIEIPNHQLPCSDCHRLIWCTI